MLGGMLRTTCTRGILSTSSMGSSRSIQTIRPGTSYVYQQSLPRLPIPGLQDTCKRYVDALRPILSEEELSNTIALVEQFENGQGKDLHEKLLAHDKANPNSSFINEFWDDMYFCLRAPLPLNVNPFIELTKMNDDDIVTRLSGLVWSSLRYRAALMDESLEPDVFHMGTVTDKKWFKTLASFAPQKFAYALPYLLNGYPLDMSQHKKMFGGARIPHKYRDEYRQTNNARHICVMYKENVYTVPVLGAMGEIYSPAQIRNALQFIVDANEGSGIPVGVFTGEDRNAWATIREQLESNPTNKATLEAIDSSLFMISLDNEGASTREGLAHQFLHGYGKNRWFDKSFSLLGSANGEVAINFEHSWGDGVCVVRYAEEVFKDQQFVKFDDTSSIDVPTKLAWDLNNEQKQQVEKSGNQLEGAGKSLDFKMSMYEKYGKNDLKKHKISPDAIAQLAIQLGHYKHHQKIVPTYESASTAGFKGGRTETIRPATVASTSFVKAMADASASNAEKGDLLRKAATVHNKISTEAKIGKGMDRHLFALGAIAKKDHIRSVLEGKGASEKDILDAQGKGGGDLISAEEVAKGLPAIFNDKGWSYINHNILSTSTLASDAIEGGGFGPVVADGYGIGYGVRDDRIGFNISSYRGDSTELGESIASSLDDMMEVLEACPPPKEEKK